MATIERRLDAVEAHGTGTDKLTLILVRFDTPGKPVGDAATAEFMNQRWTREPAETERAFIDRIRIYAETHREPEQVAVRAPR